MTRWWPLLAIGIVGGCASNRAAQLPATTRPPVEVTSTSGPAPTTATSQPTSTTTSGPPSTGPGCEPAAKGDVALVTAALTGRATRLGEAYVVVDGTSRFVGANIYGESGPRLSSADVWVIVDGQAYALSGGARSSSNLPDGRKLPGRPSAGDGPGLVVEECVAAASRSGG